MDKECKKVCEKIGELERLKVQNHNFPNYENELKKSYSVLISNGDTVIDIGAHTGAHLKVFLALVGEAGFVFGFEPLPVQFAYLMDTFFSYKNVVLINKALSNKTGIFDFFEVGDSEEESGFFERKQYNNPLNAHPRKIRVLADKLNNYMNNFSRVDFIKIDTEGSELNILESSDIVIAKYRPIISVEYGDATYSLFGFTKNSLFEFAQKCSYVLSDLWGNTIQSQDVWQYVCDRIYWDYFLVPAEKIGFFKERLNNFRET